MGQKPKCPEYNYCKKQRRQVGLYLQRQGQFLPPPSMCTRLYDVPGTQCRPTHPIPVQCWQQASQPIAGSMPVNRIRCWPNIETKLGDRPVFALTAIG